MEPCKEAEQAFIEQLARMFETGDNGSLSELLHREMLNATTYDEES